MDRLKDKIAVIAGAGGIGEATVQQFVKEGATVVVGDIDEEKGSKLVSELNTSENEVLFIKTDTTDENQVKNLIDQTVQKYGRLDILFNNAGVVNNSFIHEMSFEDWRKTMGVNIDGTFLTAKHGVNQMLKNGGGSIINTASIMGHVATPNQASYNTSKHGVVGLTKSIALEYAKDNIRANAISPGYVDTTLLDFLSKEEKEALASTHPIGRLARPEEIAKAVVFLASDDSSFMTGSSMLVDGGYTAQ